MIIQVFAINKNIIKINNNKSAYESSQDMDH